MNIDEATVLALNGAMLGEGTFEFDGPDHGQFLAPPRAMVMVRDQPLRETEFALVGNPRSDADGLYSADWPVHSVALQSTVPPIHQLLDYPSFALSADGVPSDRCRFELSSEDSAFAWVALDTEHGPDKSRESLLGCAQKLTLEAARDADGFELLLEATLLEPKRGQERVAPVTVRVRVKLSFATMALAGSRLWWRGGAGRWDQSAGDAVGPLATALTLDRAGGTPFFKGTLDLGPNLPDIYGGPWVAAHIYDGRRLILRPQREPARHPGGFYGGGSGGPDLVLHNFGPETWKELLGDRDEAELVQGGAGIGFSQRVTGRDVQDEGPHEQPIVMMRSRLQRREEGLFISLVGELGPIRQKNPYYEPLGPDFGVDFLVPSTLLFARGWTFGDMYQERKRRLGLA